MKKHENNSIINKYLNEIKEFKERTTQLIRTVEGLMSTDCLHIESKNTVILVMLNDYAVYTRLLSSELIKIQDQLAEGAILKIKEKTEEVKSNENK